MKIPQINLLPEGFAKKKKIQYGFYPIILISAGIAVFFIVSLSILLFSVRAKENTLTKLKEDFKKVDLIRKELNTLKAVNKDLKDRLLTFEDVLLPRLIISDKLITLRRNLPEGVWFTSLYIDITRVDRDKEKKFKGLKIEGMALVSEGEGMFTSLTEFVDSLKKDTSFFNDFDAIELENLKKERAGNIDATTFRLLLKLK